MDSAKREINLKELCLGVDPGLSANMGGVLAEAASICLENNNLPEEVDLQVEGEYNLITQLVWSIPTNQIKNTHADLQDATEDGACGIAIMLAKKLMGKTIVRKSYKGKNRDHAFDYWLGESQNSDELLIIQDTRLEVSGILRGGQAQLNKRVLEKINRMKGARSTFPGVVIVVLFERPLAKIVKP